ncbi:MAG: NAD(P)/FAD-dependent oxidoreductase [Ferruginibacter sp.]|nr:NAD(P)/FAD-dependent oxidoreductase [Cytophagales bacterium]
MPYDFDLLVIGTGPAGNVAASECRRAGWKVALVENRLVGGACALRACDPKKILLAAAEGFDWVHRMRDKGLTSDDIRIDWRDLMRFKRSFTETVPKNKEEEYARAGITVLKGTAQFTGEATVEVAGKEYSANRILIATGSVPAPASFEGSEHLTNSDHFLDADQLPARIVFVGAGYVSFELAHLAARAGAQVQIVDRGAAPLGKFDPDLTDHLLKASQSIGVDIRLNARIEALDKVPGGYQLHFVNDAGKHTLEADWVVHGAGRKPNVGSLEPKKAGVELNEEGGIRVNDSLQSESNPHVFAAGDAIGTFPALTPVATMHAALLTQNWLEDKKLKTDHRVIPSVAFTLPPIASVGLHEQEAKEKGLAVKVAHGSMVNWYAHRRIGDDFAAYKTLVDAQTGQVLGAHLLGHHSDELINLFALAIRAGLTAGQMKETVYAYPTHASNIRYMLPA